MGSRDYRPVPAGVPCPHCYYTRPALDPIPVYVYDSLRWCRTPAKADALFLENAHGVRFGPNVTFAFEQPRREWFGRCLRVDNHSTGVEGAEGITCIGEGV